MSRVLRVAAAQSGPIQKAESRQAVVKRMIDLLDQAKAQTCDLVVYTELALTTFFPRWYMTDQAEIDAWFEREMPNPAVRPLLEKAAEYKIAISFGYAELTPDGQALQYVNHDRPRRPDRRQVPQGAPARPRRLRSRSARSSISRSAISSRATWASRSGARWAAFWACASATTAAGRRPIG